MQKFLEEYSNYLKNINVQKQTWLIISIWFVILLVTLFLEWHNISEFNSPYLWALVCAGLISISAIWWFWTMRIISTILHHIRRELVILEDIVIDVKKMKTDIEKLKKD